MRLLLIGCSGFVGRELVPMLLEAGDTITLISRRSGHPAGLEHPGLRCLQLDPAEEASWSDPRLQSALAEAEGVVNLAGEPIAEQRWTPAHRQRLQDSRLRTTAGLCRAMASLETPPAVLVNASAVGFYGTDPEQRFVESSPAGGDFLADLCSRWEAAATAAPEATRVVLLRIGIVLGPDGGALGKMLPVFRAGFGGPVGDGSQWMSWIHRTDLCRLIIAALKEDIFRGVYNAVAPDPVTMATLSRRLGAALSRPSLLPVPAPILRILLGDGARVVLEGQQVASERLPETGFSFRFPGIDQALAAATSPEHR
ncbi:TIGR01777 family protein [Synechococcus sp. RSCCF101]|uniref:TIGR01777 family oxidoreductase n=1 Tax=Synechococcus sp. RSCCF101 TaxID=2511069 RepID=UPI0012461A1B|nr:TIGR01777 family oxidoreductase [Synechococcus sp. RSCCF101]QEY32909.1 TIGR01777 family protein [Synechococcus sp. RSCCF101]